MPGKGRWQNSDLVALIEDSLTAEGRVNNACDLVGVHRVSLETAGEGSRYGLSLEPLLDLPDLAMVNLNGLLFRCGARLNVAQGVQNASLRINASSPSVERYDISVGEEAKLKLVETFGCGNRVVSIHLDNGSTLDYVLDSEKGSDRVGYHAVIARLETGSSLRMSFSSSGGALERHDMFMSMQGVDAEVDLRGGWMLHGSSHLDINTIALHDVGSCTSTQSFHGVVDDRARASFSGSIKIQPGATATEAHLVSRNISLSPHARANAQPDLEIFTDDVICSHGVTCGQLSEDELFLLRSRGIEEKSAERMLVSGFLRQVVSDEVNEELLRA